MGSAVAGQDDDLGCFEPRRSAQDLNDEFERLFDVSAGIAVREDQNRLPTNEGWSSMSSPSQKSAYTDYLSEWERTLPGQINETRDVTLPPCSGAKPPSSNDEDDEDGSQARTSFEMPMFEHDARTVQTMGRIRGKLDRAKYLSGCLEHLHQLAGPSCKKTPDMSKFMQSSQTV